MTTPKLDEARLRELAARLRDIRRGEKITSFELRDIHDACNALDALSAERERVDRAVEYIAKEIHAGRDFVGKREWTKGTNRKYYRRQAEQILAAPGREWKHG